MISVSGKMVYLACGSTDMRKSIDGLTAMVERSFKLNPFENAVFVFCNKPRDRIKVLEWDGDGFWLHFKRLERGHFRWPTDDGTLVMKFTDEDLKILLGGTKIERKIRRNEVLQRRAI